MINRLKKQHEQDFVLTFRCICSQDCPPPEASRSHTIQPPGSGGPTPGSDVPHASSHQSAAAASGGCKGECCAIRGAWRPSSAPDFIGLLFGPFGPAAMPLLHFPTHLLPPPGPSEPPLSCPVWGFINPLWVSCLPISLAGGNWRHLPEEDLLSAPRNPVWPPLCPCFGFGCLWKVHSEQPALWYSPFKRAYEQGLCGANQRWWKWEDGVRMLKGRFSKRPREYASGGRYICCQEVFDWIW